MLRRNIEEVLSASRHTAQTQHCLQCMSALAMARVACVHTLQNAIAAIVSTVSIVSIAAENVGVNLAKCPSFNAAVAQTVSKGPLAPRFKSDQLKAWKLRGKLS